MTETEPPGASDTFVVIFPGIMRVEVGRWLHRRKLGMRPVPLTHSIRDVLRAAPDKVYRVNPPPTLGTPHAPTPPQGTR